MLKLIAAVADNGVIGRENSLPFKLSGDLKNFKTITGNSAVMMGRSTHVSIRNMIHGPLPDRENIVLTRSPNNRLDLENGITISTFEAVIKRGVKEDIWIIGGAEVYTQALPFVQEMHLTRVHAQVEGDTHFPDFDLKDWVLISSIDHDADDKNEFPFTWEVYYRRARYIEMRNCRSDKQREEMQIILEAGHCPFCTENLRLYHKGEILFRTRHWIVSTNDYPYKAAKNHLIMFLKVHAENASEIPADAGNDIIDILRWAEREFGIKGSGFFMRSGELLWTGGTIRHIHAHIAHKKTIDSEPVVFYLG